jgi:ADP-ribosylglycohydrolase
VITLYAALVAGDFREGMLLAANHPSDTDSSGTVTGNLFAALGDEAALSAA